MSNIELAHALCVPATVCSVPLRGVKRFKVVRLQFVDGARVVESDGEEIPVSARVPGVLSLATLRALAQLQLVIARRNGRQAPVTHRKRNVSATVRTLQKEEWQTSCLAKGCALVCNTRYVQVGVCTYIHKWKVACKFKLLLRILTVIIIILHSSIVIMILFR